MKSGVYKNVFRKEPPVDGPLKQKHSSQIERSYEVGSRIGQQEGSSQQNLVVQILNS